VLGAIMQGAVLPPAGSVIGAGEKTCCEECGRPRKEKHLKHFYRVWEIETKPEECLLEQGFICMGPATRSGCGALCVKANQPCRGCYGPSGEVEDQGAAMIGALGSILDASTEERAQEMIDQIADPVGTFYRF